MQHEWLLEKFRLQLILCNPGVWQHSSRVLPLHTNHMQSLHQLAQHSNDQLPFLTCMRHGECGVWAVASLLLWLWLSLYNQTDHWPLDMHFKVISSRQKQRVIVHLLLHLDNVRYQSCHLMKKNKQVFPLRASNGKYLDLFTFCWLKLHSEKRQKLSTSLLLKDYCSAKRLPAHPISSEQFSWTERFLLHCQHVMKQVKGNDCIKPIPSYL